MPRSTAFLIMAMSLMLYSVGHASDNDKLTAYDLFSLTRSEKNLALFDGIAALKWGISIDDAKNIYPDLKEINDETYSKYKEGGEAEYRRENENLRFAGYSMESVDYKFKREKLASVSSTINCNKDTPCDAHIIFQDMVDAAKKLYGKPYKISSKIREDDETIKKQGGIVNDCEIEWVLDDESIHMTKMIYPRFSYIIITIFSYQGYFIAEGPAEAATERYKMRKGTALPNHAVEEKNYSLSDGFRALKWGTKLDDAKKIYPDLLFVDQIPKTVPKFFRYRKGKENKNISGIEWERISYSFSKAKTFCSVNANARYELAEKMKAVELFNDMFDRISTKYGKPFHYERTDKEGYPYVYYSIWHLGTESVSLELKAATDHWIIRNQGIKSNPSILEFSLHLYSKKGEGNDLDF